jgi:hypothetical protein
LDDSIASMAAPAISGGKAAFLFNGSIGLIEIEEVQA